MFIKYSYEGIRNEFSRSRVKHIKHYRGTYFYRVAYKISR